MNLGTLLPFVLQRDKPLEAPPKVEKPDVGTASISDQIAASYQIGSAEYGPVGAKFMRAKAWAAFRDMRRDPVLSSAIELKCYLPTAHGYQIEAASDDPRHIEQQEFLQYAFDSMEGDGIYGVIDKLTDGVAVGFSVQEKIWAKTPTGERFVATTRAIDPQLVSFDIDEFYRVHKLLMTVPGVSQNKPYPVDKFIYWTFNPSYEHPYGHGDFMEAYRAWFIKAEVTKLYAQYLERNAYGGIEVTKYKQGMTEEQIEKLKTESQKEGPVSKIFLPDGSTFEFIPLASSQMGNAYLDCIKQQNEEMVRAVLGSSLMVDEGSRVGSKAMAQVHLDTFRIGAMQLSRAIETVVNKSIIEPTIKVNYPGETKFPKFKLPQPSAAEQEMLANRIHASMDRDVISSDEPWVRSMLGYPADERDEDERADDDAAKKLKSILDGEEADGDKVLKEREDEKE